jgi:hypothetical protein
MRRLPDGRKCKEMAVASTRVLIRKKRARRGRATGDRLASGASKD